LADLFIVGVAPIDYSPILLLKPFGFRIAPDTLSSGIHRATGSRSVLAVSGFRLRARLDFSIPSCSPGQRGITPAFGYSAPHPSAEGRDRDTARATLGQGFGCFGVSAVRARLALSIVHVSVRPPCHPGRSHFASPVGDHDCPSAVFPASHRLKRSLAYPHTAQVYCTVRWRCALPT